MSHDRHYQQAQEDEYHHSRRGHGGNGHYYDDQQGNPYAYYDQQPQQQDHGYGYESGYGRDQQVMRDPGRDRYAGSDDDGDVSAPCTS